LRRLGDRGPVLSPSVSQLKPGRNRFGFGLFDVARAQIADAPVAVYVARPRANAPVHGPFLAHWESLAVKPQFQSRTVATDPDAARSLYVADIDLPSTGDWQVFGVARLDGRLVAAMPSGGALRAQPRGSVPDVGAR